MSSESPTRKQPYHHHHVMRHKAQSVPAQEPALVEQEIVDELVSDCVKTICVGEAYKQAITSPLIEPAALESLMALMEEYILKILSMVRRSMLAARRTVPIAADFETAIEVLDIPRPDDHLKPYKSQPPINRPFLPTPPPEDVFHNTVELPATFLGPELDGHGELKKFSFNTRVLPELPSAHTFKDTPVYPYRENDTRRIRELATKEGKLGEQALRKLAGAVKLDATHPLESEATKRRSKVTQRKRWKDTVDISEETVFEETLRDLLAKEPGGFELGPIVTCEKSYRMPDDVQVKRRAPVNEASLTQPARVMHSSSNLELF
ncbi:hypothetical protein LTR10_014518 [Elasticomyces elasticus]|uniref:Transcription initiation factor TFIID subunit 8 n=1 Tax=Exophiala sideris TaxID=1016849 RepID=A0ABR0JSD7_9EURO|nr:hypothetical protein LTR10_014518 [Elasticomyces elasticus]KAK5040497.1 hypothetical protein LTS07_000995 [Exophiala sideris]KAK5043077.1 hypothetical protein LTR13_000848 [Exophiala sideris]KAK5068875.1 hypothetical protein LTR69_000996 [Exophiala sideris]KAK5186471.1 hypothetical protein LTR44_001527 [Eurotiomycetes sp. CCFEE 6388]